MPRDSVCSKGSASSVEVVNIATAVMVMAAQPTREAPPTTAILFPFLRISIPLFVVLRAGEGNVRFGSEADIQIGERNVPLYAINRHRVMLTLSAQTSA